MAGKMEVWLESMQLSSRNEGCGVQSPRSTSRPNRATNGILTVIALVPTVGLLPWLDKPMFRDEGASLYSAHLDWTALGQQSRVVDLMLLPYYSLLHLWIEISDSIEWLRFLSVLAFGLTVFIVGHLGTRLGGRRCGVVAAILVATNPLMIEGGLNARPYALSALAATASVAALIRWLDGNEVRWIWWFFLASMVSLLLQLFSVLGPLSALVAAVALRPQVFRARWRVLIAPIGLLLAATVSSGIFASSQRGQISWIPSFDGKQLVNAMEGPASGVSSFYAITVLIIAIVSISLCIRAWSRGSFRPTRLELERFTIFLAWAALPTAILIAVSLLKPVFVDRYMTASAPGLALAVGLLTARAFDVTAVRWAIWSRAVMGGFCAGVTALVISAASVPAAQNVPENLREAAQYLALHVGPGGAAALPDHSLTAAIDYYLREDHKTVASWPQLAVQPYIEGLDLRQDRKTLKRTPNDIWLVDDGSVTGTPAFIRLLTHDGYIRTDTTHFVRVDVVHFRRTAS